MAASQQPEADNLEYWKKQAKYYEQKAIDIQTELDEYTENSAQLEKELEASLGQVEKQNRDLENQNQRQKKEIESLKNKLERSQHEMNALENELQALKIDKEKQALYIRELEQKNDDLERAQRVISESVSCIESLLNQAYERNAVLENEVDEVETLRVKLQRATDEARDLKQELKVLEKIPPLKKEEDGNTESILTNGIVSTPACAQGETPENESKTILTTPLKLREINGNAMTPSARVSAINIVGDLLRKVGLERLLCRQCDKVKCSCDLPPSDDSLTSTSRQSELRNSPIIDRNGTSSNVETVEYRSKTLSRPPLGPDSHVVYSKSSQRLSEQPFVRASLGEPGKLRKSFVVRSREGFENLLGIARKGPDQTKTAKGIRQ